MCACVHMEISVGQKMTSDILGLELEVVVSHIMWVLGTELMSKHFQPLRHLSGLTKAHSTH